MTGGAEDEVIELAKTEPEDLTYQVSVKKSNPTCHVMETSIVGCILEPRSLKKCGRSKVRVAPTSGILKIK